MFAGMVMWDNLVLKGGWSRAIELSSLACALILSPLVEAALVTILMRCRWWGTPVIVLSSDNAGSRLVESLQRRRELGLIPIALLKNRAENWGKTVAGVPVLGAISLAPTLTRYARTVIVAMPSFRPQLPALVARLPFPRVRVRARSPRHAEPLDDRTRFGRHARNRVPAEPVAEKKLLSEARPGLRDQCAFLLGSIPLIAVFAFWIKRISPGPAFYTQEREGYRGGKIRVWKLRTMYPDADKLLKRYLAEQPARTRPLAPILQTEDMTRASYPASAACFARPASMSSRSCGTSCRAR